MKANPETAVEVRRILEQFAQAYGARKSVEEVLAFFAQDDDVTVVGTRLSDLRRGIEQVRAQIAKDWSGPQSYTMEIEKCDVSSAGDVAWACVQMRHVLSAGSPESTGPARLTCVLERRNGRWLIMQWHKSRPSGP
jgi:ketosteroid isomerase-like protein